MSPLASTKKNINTPSAKTTWCGRGSFFGTGTLISRKSYKPGAELLDLLAVGLAEAVRHPGQEFPGEAGDLVDQARELALTEDDQLHVAVGDDGRVAGCLLQ